MATARVVPIPQEPPPRKVILELSEEEAAALYVLCEHSSSDGSNGVDDPDWTVYDALSKVFDIEWPESSEYLDEKGHWRDVLPPFPRLK